MVEGSLTLVIISIDLKKLMHLNWTRYQGSIILWKNQCIIIKLKFIGETPLLEKIVIIGGIKIIIDWPIFSCTEQKVLMKKTLLISARKEVFWLMTLSWYHILILGFYHFACQWIAAPLLESSGIIFGQMVSKFDHLSILGDMLVNLSTSKIIF